MTRLRTAIATLTLIACSAPAFAAEHPKNINKRQAVQQRRIAEGLEHGTLTPREAANLEKQEARINTLEAKARNSGGGLSPKERAELDRLLNAESHRIYQQKHDKLGQ